jgi:16S rRNA (adenine1518-N6/adenine1519-N6)-dimethyltransferase
MAVTLHHGDVLQFDWLTLATEQPWRLVGNLPYNISTPLLFHIFSQLDLFTDMHFVLQNEVVNRLVAPVDSKNYGRLSVMTQYHCQAQSLLFIPPESFEPPPKVDSALVRLIPRQNKAVVANDLGRFTDVVREAFSFRRKTLSNALKAYFTSDQLEQLGINPKLRPQNISVDQYVTLANATVG